LSGPIADLEKVSTEDLFVPCFILSGDRLAAVVGDSMGSRGGNLYHLFRLHSQQIHRIG
jgi:hypothetical protein